MSPWTRRQAISRMGMAAAVPLLSSCTEESGGAPEPGRTAGSTSPGPSPSSAPIDPESVVETRSLSTNLGQIEIAVHPIIRVGDHCVLTLDIETIRLPDGEDSMLLSRFEGDATLAGGAVHPEDWAGVRLVDTGGGQVRLAATAEDHTVAGRSTWPRSVFAQVYGGTLRRQLIFAAPEEGTEQIGLLLPGWFLPEVPVLDGEVPEVEPGDDEQELPDTEMMLAAVTEAPVLLLEGYSRQLDGGVQVLESNEKIEIRLAGDVLFDSSSYELDARADEVLAAAAQSITGYAGGVVEIVGHTDDVGTEADNQELSENRAQAVAEDLGARIDISVYELRTGGRGESEPLVPNDSDENRQQNRRVTLTLTSEKSSQVEVTTSGEMPPFDDGVLHDGTEADGPEGFDRTLVEGSTYHISCPVVRRVEGMLEVTVQAERLEGGEYGSYGSAVTLGAGVHSYRGNDTGYSRDFAGFAPRLLVGATATYPLDYLLGTSFEGTDEEWRIVSDQVPAEDCLVGETVRFVALYRDLPGLDTIVVEQPFVLGTTPFRLTGIPIQG